MRLNRRDIAVGPETSEIGKAMNKRLALKQYRELFEKARLDVSRVIPTMSAVRIVEGIRCHKAHEPVPGSPAL